MARSTCGLSFSLRYGSEGYRHGCAVKVQPPHVVMVAHRLLINAFPGMRRASD